MRRGTLRNSALCIAAVVALSACGGSGESDQLNNGQGGDPNTPGVGPGPGGTTQGGGGTTDQDQQLLDSRKVDYGEALRTASLKLVGELPTFDQIQKIATAPNEAAQKTAYEAEIDKMLADPRFAPVMIKWWRDTLATGGNRGATFPSYEFSATFAASIVVNDRPYSDMFTAKNGTCPTFTAGAAGAAGTFAAADCPGTQPTAGLVANPDLMSNYYGNMAFRRVRMLQEKFACSKYPAEFATAPKPMGAGTYTSPWPFDSVPGAAAKVNFQDTSAVICANCHTSMNRTAPLFANWDDKGAYNAAQVAVMTPVPGNPRTIPTDWLPAGDTAYAWRNGKPTPDVAALGAAMAADTDVQRCINTRMYNWAMSKGDVVNDLAAVPAVITDPFVKVFNDNGQKIKPVIRAVFTSEDFVKF